MEDNNQPTIVQWEYQRLDISHYTPGGCALLKNIGYCGWELVACLPIDSEHGLYIFKRLITFNTNEHK